MEVKFDVYFKKNLGTLFKENEVDLDGVEANVNIDLSLVDSMKINYKIGENNYTDDVLIKDDNLIQIPFKSDVVKKGLNEFEVVAYMENGDIKVSQTYIYDISESIGEGDEIKDTHNHSNLDVLNSITEARVNEWDSKAEGEHEHSISDIKGLEDIEVDLSNYYTKGEADNKILEEVSKIEVVKGEKGDKGDKGDNGLTPNITIGEVTTLEPNQNATVEITGTIENPILNFGIPKGEQSLGSVVPIDTELYELVNLTIEEGMEATSYTFTSEATPNMSKCKHFIIRISTNDNASSPWVKVVFNNVECVNFQGGNSAFTELASITDITENNFIKSIWSNYYNSSLASANFFQPSYYTISPSTIGSCIENIKIYSYMNFIKVGGSIKIWGYC